MTPQPPAESALASRADAPGAIDASCRWPVTLLLWKALGWLALAAGLHLLAAIQLHAPTFLAGVPWLTFGRLRPAAMNTLLYGFACQAALALGLWLACRLGRVRLRAGPAVLIAGGAWNLTVFLGVLGILAGASTGMEWLEMPAWTGPVLWAGGAVLGGLGLRSVARRAERGLYVSQWYLLAAWWSFVWALAGAQLLLHHRPVRGVMEAVVGAWYRGCFLELWLTPVLLAAVFYFVPKRVGRPLFSRGLAQLGFWTQVLVGGWTGCTQLIGGPVPAWMLSVSSAAQGVLLVAMLCVGLNLHATLGGRAGWAAALREPTLRYLVLGAVCSLGAGLLGVGLSTRTVAALTRFTQVETARVLLLVLGGFGLTVLGAAHDLIPRLLRAPWPDGRLDRAGFWGSALGVGLIFTALTAAGLVQAVKLHQPAVPAGDAIRAMTPFLGLATVGWGLLLAGQVAWLLQVGRMLAARWAPAWRAAWRLWRGVDAPAVPGQAQA